MKVPEKYPNSRALRTEASELLSMNGNRLKLIEALILCLLLVPLYCSVYNLIAFAATEFVMVPSLVWTWIRNGTSFFITLLLTLPLILGVFGMAARMQRGEDTVLIDLFAPFTSWSRYMSAVWLSWKILWIPSLAALLMWGSVGLFDALLISDAQSATMLGWFTASVFGILGLFFMMRRFTAIAAAINGQPSVSPTKPLSGWKRYKHCDRFWRMYLVRILLGILSMGVLLLLDVIPEMLIAYFRYYNYMNDNDVTSEE
ncbi:MAG: hypothetical protein IJW49_01685 [Clostridia bacterium]|nr:hypothetical protein [Clostridia bacterium]